MTSHIYAIILTNSREFACLYKIMLFMLIYRSKQTFNVKFFVTKITHISFDKL